MAQGGGLEHLLGLDVAGCGIIVIRGGLSGLGAQGCYRIGMRGGADCCFRMGDGSGRRGKRARGRLGRDVGSRRRGKSGAA